MLYNIRVLHSALKERDGKDELGYRYVILAALVGSEVDYSMDYVLRDIREGSEEGAVLELPPPMVPVNEYKRWLRKELGVSSALFTAEALRERAAAVYVESDSDIPIDLRHVKPMRVDALMATEEGRQVRTLCLWSLHVMSRYISSNFLCLIVPNGAVLGSMFVQRIADAVMFWETVASYISPDADAECVKHDWSHRHKTVVVDPTSKQGGKQLQCPPEAKCDRHQLHVCTSTDTEAYRRYKEELGDKALSKTQFVSYKPFFYKRQTWKSCLCQTHLLFELMCKVRTALHQTSIT
jgi:hypothetical protein